MNPQSPAGLSETEHLQVDAHLQEFAIDREATLEWAVLHKFDWPSHQWSRDDAQVRVDWSKKAGTGCHREVYMMFNETWNRNQVVKVATANSDNATDQYPQIYFNEAQMQSQCEDLAHQFNECVSQALDRRAFTLSDPSTLKHVEYTPMWVIEFHNGLFGLVEDCLTGHFRKYTNNYGFVHPKAHDLPLAFSHWTFLHTDAQLMVVDVQGVVSVDKEVFTDPQLLSYTPHGRVFGKCDVGAVGMKKFFDSHECNEICCLVGCAKVNEKQGTDVKFVSIPDTFVHPEENPMFFNAHHSPPMFHPQFPHGPPPGHSYHNEFQQYEEPPMQYHSHSEQFPRHPQYHGQEVNHNAYHQQQGNHLMQYGVSQNALQGHGQYTRSDTHTLAPVHKPNRANRQTRTDPPTAHTRQRDGSWRREPPAATVPKASLTRNPPPRLSDDTTNDNQLSNSDLVSPTPCLENCLSATRGPTTKRPRTNFKR